jgi:hypothetical protein
VDIDRFYLGNQDHDDKLSSRVRRFYKKQDNLIDSFQKLHEQTSFDPKKDLDLNKQKRYTEWLIRATLICNVVSISTYKINLLILIQRHY